MPGNLPSILYKLDILLRDLEICIEQSKSLIAESNALIEAVRHTRGGESSSRETCKTSE